MFSDSHSTMIVRMQQGYVYTCVSRSLSIDTFSYVYIIPYRICGCALKRNTSTTYRGPWIDTVGPLLFPFNEWAVTDPELIVVVVESCLILTRRY